MSVRIIFRGLILFRFPGKDPERPDKIVAHLINKRDLPERPGKQDAQGPEEGHEHYHEGLIQILTGDPVEDMAPEPLRRLEDIDITANGTGGVVIEESFLRHVPRLSDIIDKGKGNVKGPVKGDDTPTIPDLIQNTITVNRGQVRVRNVVTWDQGGFPLPAGTQPTAQPASHASINFVGSDVSGYFASEFVVDIPAATGVTLHRKTNRALGKDRDRLTASTSDAKEQRRRDKLNRPHDARKNANHRVRQGSVEILITNYEYQGGAAIPWGLDFQWLFEALGYAPVDLNDAGFGEFAEAARAYDAGVYLSEVGMLLQRRGDAAVDATDPFTIGLPFPYIRSAEALVPLRQPTDEESRPICIGAFQGGGP